MTETPFPVTKKTLTKMMEIGFSQDNGSFLVKLKKHPLFSHFIGNPHSLYKELRRRQGSEGCRHMYDVGGYVEY